MKKALLVLAVAGFFASCSNSSDAAKNTKDSIDSVAKLQKESVSNAADTAKKNIEQMADSAKKQVDSTHKMAADTAHK
ncbi:hypothetical protein [Flavisolibacter ginsenosidimutans]|uniref:Lipoprotein n=1 Tax=Flavisolibacter ginsenosidimutans TaxID=661481 RepID=A0A5B8UNK0_9BACT|nr:hypothetical protein [Flavisolibacter ginsenosidimutans]QEC58224.1 hypothetical protein FSB75_20715 [Flavisolibacter ginsenosidimutans]